MELDLWLREWLRQPRIPVLESAEPEAARLIDAALRGEEVESHIGLGPFVTAAAAAEDP